MDADPTLTLLREASGPPPTAPDPSTFWRAGRRRRMTRRLAPVIALALVGLGGALAFVISGHRSPQQTISAGSPRTQAHPTTSPAITQPTDAAPAEWRTDPQHPPSADATMFVALVRQSGCPPPLASELHEPTVLESAAEVVVQFTSVPSSSRKLCAELRTTPFVVHLAKPLGRRRLVDDACRSLSHGCMIPAVERWPKHQPTFSSPSPQPLLFGSIRLRTSGPCIPGGRGPDFVRPGLRGRLCYRLGTPGLRVRVKRAHPAAGATPDRWMLVVSVSADTRADLVNQFACPENAVCLRRWVAVLVNEEVVATLTIADLERPTLTLGPFRRGMAEGLALTLPG